MNFLLPLMIHEPPSPRTALVSSELMSDPKSGSVMPIVQPARPDVISGRNFSRAASLLDTRQRVGQAPDVRNSGSAATQVVDVRRIDSTASTYSRFDL